jgi:hypothetical protein
MTHAHLKCMEILQLKLVKVVCSNVLLVILEQLVKLVMEQFLFSLDLNVFVIMAFSLTQLIKFAKQFAVLNFTEIQLLSYAQHAIHYVLHVKLAHPLVLPVIQENI